MIKRIFSVALLLVMIVSCNSNNKQNKTKKASVEKYNLVYVFPDQFRKQALAFWDSPDFKGSIRTKADPVKTPALDKFAKESVVLTQMVSNFPLCSPHRGSLFSGMYPSESGVPLNCNSTRPISSLRNDLECFTDVLHKAGYSQGYIGKWHLNFPTPNDPANPGNYVDPRRPAWDTYTPKEQRHSVDYWYSYGTWDVHKDPHYYDNNGKRYDPKEWSPRHEANKAIEYLDNKNGERDPNKPFALFVAMNPPHSPYKSIDDCLEEDYNKYKNVGVSKLLHRDNADTTMAKTKKAPFYFANVSGVDREFGRIVQHLKDMNLYDKTIVVFTSDHGETMCSHGINEPKNNIYSEALDIPFMIHYPGLKNHRTDNIIMGSPDIMPTILGMLGLKDKIPSTVQGSNYSDIIEGKTDKGRPYSALYIRNFNGEKDKDGKVISYFPVARGVKTHKYSLELKINKKKELEATQFFNDDKDPYQLENLTFDKNNEDVKKLLKELAYWLKRSNDPWYKEKILSDLIPYN